MTTIIKYLDGRVKELQEEELNTFVDNTLTIFEARVLPLTDSKYPQYIFLHLCSVNEQFMQKFITLIIMKAFNQKKHVNM